MTTAKYISDTPTRETRLNKTDTAWHWYNVWKRMSKNNDNKWGDLEIVAPDVDSDLFIIINHPGIPTAYEEYDPKRTIVIQLEPPCVRGSNWREWRNPNPDDFLYVFDIKNHHMTIDWNILQTYQDLLVERPVKTKLFSTIQTWKAYHPGHQLREVFLKQYLNGFPELDIYGMLKQDEPAAFKYENYCGAFGMRAKEPGLLPYKYHFCCENSSVDNYFTEKIVDALLCECLPLYWGCPNLSDFLPPHCCIWLPLENPKEALDRVNWAIHTNQYGRRLPMIREAKMKILNELQFFPTMDKLIKELL